MTTTSKKTTITLYNYRSRSLEPFMPMGESVGIYTCGPTVYNRAHIGNFRTYIFEDVLKRLLRYLGYSVTHVMNITDVEDKIIRDAAGHHQQIGDLTRPYEELFYRDLEALAIEPADVLPRATEHIPQMIEMIQMLLDTGLAYVADGSVYFSIAKFPDYGKLAGLSRAQLRPGARVDVDEYDKEAAEDFALWKAVKPADERVGAVWDAPWGRGRPGWHIECSAMSRQYLGDTFDIHAGAIDLLFPHHEDEIAQSEGATGKEFARFFLEGEHLLVDGHKMAKSAGNFYTLADLEKEGFSPRAFRYMVLGAHYRSKLNFTWASLKAAANTLAKLDELRYRPADKIDYTVVEYIDQALANDLDTPQALAILHEQNNPTLWQRYDTILGLGFGEPTADAPAAVKELLDEREKARTARDFTQADKLRAQIAEQGWDVEDGPAGPRLIPQAKN